MGDYKSEDCAGTGERVSERLEAQASPPPAGLFPCGSPWPGPVSPALSAAQAHLPLLAALLSSLGSVCSLPCSTFPPQQPVQGPSDSSMSYSHGTRGHAASQLEVTFQGMCPGASEKITLWIIATSRKKSLSGLIFTLSPSSPAEVRFQTLHASSTTSFLPSASGLPDPTGRSSCPQHWLLRPPSASQYRKLLLASRPTGTSKAPTTLPHLAVFRPLVVSYTKPAPFCSPFLLLLLKASAPPSLDQGENNACCFPSSPHLQGTPELPPACPTTIQGPKGPTGHRLLLLPAFALLSPPLDTRQALGLPSLACPTPAPVAWTRPPHLRP